jgi:hypothetical protein
MLALMKYGDRAASTRQRLLQFLPYLQDAGIDVEVCSLLDNDYVVRIGRGRAWSFGPLVGAYSARIGDLVRAREFDVIWVYGEVFPFLPGLLERLAFLYNKPVIYDFDDAMFHQYDANNSVLIRRMLGRKLEPLLRGAAACCCGNEYLKSYAARFCRACIIVPTVVDTDVLRPFSGFGRARSLTVGWIGSPSTWRYVEPFIPLLRRVCETENVKLKIVGSGRCDLDFQAAEFRDWSPRNEVSDLQSFDIGIMPLADDLWARGKCGYKLLQYMACGTPVVASPVGVNSIIVKHELNGYLASTASQWEEFLVELIRRPEKRAAFGRRGRQFVVENYSLSAVGPKLPNIIRKVYLAAATGRPFIL